MLRCKWAKYHITLIWCMLGGNSEVTNVRDSGLSTRVGCGIRVVLCWGLKLERWYYMWMTFDKEFIWLKWLKRVKWVRPLQGWFKLNTDVAFVNLGRAVSGGDLIRNSQGIWILFTFETDICKSSTHLSLKLSNKAFKSYQYHKREVIIDQICYPNSILPDAANRLSIRFGKKSSIAGSFYFSVVTSKTVYSKNRALPRSSFSFLRRCFKALQFGRLLRSHVCSCKSTK